MDDGTYYSFTQHDKARKALIDGVIGSKIVAVYAARTGRRKRSAAKKLLGIGATRKRTASMKVKR